MSMIGNLAEVTTTQLERLKAGSTPVASFLYDESGSGPVSQEDMDKAWHGIHFLLTGEAWGGNGPEAMALLGGTPIGEDVGYGPARYLTPLEAATVSSALSAISRETLEQRYVPSNLEKNQIYPTGIWEDEGAEAFEYLGSYYEQLVNFYQRVSANGNAVLLYIN